MKKAIYTLAILASVFTSCTGDIEDDISTLEENLTALQAENDALQAELDGVSNNLTDGGFDITSPTKVNHEYTNDGVTTSETIAFLSTNAFYSQYNNYNSYKSIEAISNNPTYTHLVAIYGSSINDNEIRLEFYYNSDTKEATFQEFRFEEGFYYYNVNTYTDTDDVEHTLIVSSFDTTTGEISLSFEMEFNSDYNYANSDSGKVSFSFNDTLEEINSNNF